MRSVSIVAVKSDSMCSVSMSQQTRMHSIVAVKSDSMHAQRKHSRSESDSMHVQCKHSRSEIRLDARYMKSAA